MGFATIDERLLSYSGASKAFHEKWGWKVCWVGGKQFARKLMAKPDAKQPYAGRHLPSPSATQTASSSCAPNIPMRCSRAAIPTGARGSRSIWAPVFPRISRSTSVA